MSSMRSRTCFSLILRQIAGNAPRNNNVAHEPVPETSISGAQDALSQDAAMSVHERKGSVIADCTDVAQVICQSLQFAHQRPQPYRASRRLDPARIFDCKCECERVGNRGIPGRTSRELRAARNGGPAHKPLNALVCVTETFFEPHHRLAVRREPEVPRFDDPGMNWPNGEPDEAPNLRPG